MYSTTIKPKVDMMFKDIGKKVTVITANFSDSNEIINNVTKLVSSELTTRSKSILSDMLFDLSDSLLKTEFFADITRQNKFFEINLRQEILSKYQFTSSNFVSYKEASKKIQALKIGGVTFVAGGIIEVGVVLKAGLSSIIPIPISILIIASIGAALADYHIAGPIRNKKVLIRALNSYLIRVKKQFLEWFDEIENFFNKRVEEIKQAM